MDSDFLEMDSDFNIFEHSIADTYQSAIMANQSTIMVTPELVPVLNEVVTEKMTVKSTSSESVDMNQTCDINVWSDLNHIGQLKINHNKVFSFGRTKHEITVEFLAISKCWIHLQLRTAYIERINPGNHEIPSQAVNSCECTLMKSRELLHCSCSSCCYEWDAHEERVKAAKCRHKTLKGSAELPVTSFGCGFRSQYQDLESEVETALVLSAGETRKYLYTHNGKKRAKTPYMIIKGIEL